MHAVDFARCRHYLGKTQTDLARLLGLSPKAVQSFEQGWRHVPAHAERQLLFLVYLKRHPVMDILPCWEQKNCEPEIRDRCIAREVQAGHLCWFLTGTMCEGKLQGSWEEKMQHCRQCGVFRSLIPAGFEPGCEALH